MLGLISKQVKPLAAIPLCTLLAQVLLLFGCAGNSNYAPVVDRQEQPFGVKNSHIVSRGETLFSIAWRYELDYRRLAITNDIKSPYQIYPGQKLLLKEAPVVTKSTAANTHSRSTSPTVSSVNKPTVVPPTNKKNPSSKSTSLPKQTTANATLSAWHWPVKGRILRQFRAGSSTHKGIDIGGKLGEPVFAANNGSVVYAGSGLVGYGNLLIIRHDANYLSAYAHNSSLLVKEGQRVRVGQVIAKVGDSGTDQTKLHFEIRLNGKPQDPLKLLPRM